MAYESLIGNNLFHIFKEILKSIFENYEKI